MSDIKIESNIDKAIKDLGYIINAYPSETDKFLKGEATKLRGNVSRDIKANTKKITGNLRKGIKKSSKPYSIAEERKMRVYAGKPAFHANLVEYGHKQNVKARNIFFWNEREFEDDFYNDAEKFIDEVLNK